jgi:hypothetical protein
LGSRQLENGSTLFGGRQDENFRSFGNVGLAAIHAAVSVEAALLDALNVVVATALRSGLEFVTTGDVFGLVVLPPTEAGFAKNRALNVFFQAAPDVMVVAARVNVEIANGQCVWAFLESNFALMDGTAQVTVNAGFNFAAVVFDHECASQGAIGVVDRFEFQAVTGPVGVHAGSRAEVGVV